MLSLKLDILLFNMKNGGIVRREYNDDVNASMTNREDLGVNYTGNAKVALDHNGYGLIGWSNV